MRGGHRVGFDDSRHFFFLASPNSFFPHGVAPPLFPRPHPLLPTPSHPSTHLTPPPPPLPRPQPRSAHCNHTLLSEAVRCPGKAPSLFVGAVLDMHRLPSQSVACKSASPPAAKRERSNNIERVEPRRARRAASLAALARPGWARWGRWGERLEAMTGPPRVRARLRPLCVLALVRLFLHLHRCKSAWVSSSQTSTRRNLSIRQFRPW